MLNQLLEVMILTLTASTHSCEVQLEMNEMSEFVLLANVKHLMVCVVFPLVEDASESTLEVAALMQVEKAVVEHCSDPFTKLLKINMNSLLLL